jgi:hypothetical protein
MVSLRFVNPSMPCMVATVNINKGEDIVTVPYDNWQPIEKVMPHSPLCQKLNEAGALVEHLSHPWRNSFFAVFMIEQLKAGPENSEYYQYFSHFPEDQSHYPGNFSEKEKELVAGCTDLLFKAEERNIIDSNDYTLLCSVCPELKDTVSLEEFKRGKKWASTRAYELAFTDGGKRGVMIPFIEFAQVNQGMAANVNLMQIDSAMKVVANKNIKKGEMIVQQRAIASNLDVFINSGFLPGNNEHNNTAMITCTIEPEDPLFATKLELI